MSAPIVIRQNPKGNFLYSFGALAMSAISLFFTLMDFRVFAQYRGIYKYLFENQIICVLLKVILAVGFVFFGYGFIFYLKRAKQGKNILTVDEHGITDNSSALAFGFIPWKDIGGINIGCVLDNAFIEVSLNNEMEYLGKLSAIKRQTILINRKLGYQAVCITLNSTGVSPYDLLPDIEQKFLEAKAGNG